MAVEFATRRFRELATTVGRSALHALYRNDFEVYIMALELTDGGGNTIDYFAFPVLPNQISKTEPKRTNIKQTSGGTTVLTSNAFISQSIQIKGDFGRTFKILLSPRGPSAIGTAFSTNNGVYRLSQINAGTSTVNLRLPIFNVGVKTGYGAFKILQGIINKSNGVDRQGRPFRLFFYNLPLGESYLVSVPPSGLQSNQNLERNMIWTYTLNMNVLAYAEDLVSEAGQSSLTRVLGTSIINQGINAVSSNITNLGI